MADSSVRAAGQTVSIGNVAIGAGGTGYVGVFGNPETGTETGPQALAFKEMNRRLHDVTTATQDTCRWLLTHEAYLEWQQTHSLLWIKGKPGVGKSTLMKYIFERHTQRAEALDMGVVASFFCHGRGVDLQHSPRGLFRALIHQILLQDDDSRLDFDLLFQTRCSREGKYNDKWEWHETELRLILEKYLRKVSCKSPVRVFVDGLDECEEASALLEFFKALTSHGSEAAPTRRLNICVSSRHYPVIGDGQSLNLHVENENAKDIERYVAKQLREVVKDNIAVRALTKDITAKAAHVFQWAALVLKRVIISWRQRETLQAIKGDINRTPEQLQDLYRDIVDRVQDRALFQRLIEWVALAEAPLNLAQIRFALAIDPSHDYLSPEEIIQSDTYVATSGALAERIRHISSGLVETVHKPRTEIKSKSPTGIHDSEQETKDDEQFVQFIHQSVLDCFVATDGLAALRKCTQVEATGDAHTTLARTCFQYVRAHSKVCVDLVHVAPKSWTARASEFVSMIEKAKSRYPLIEYAAKNWSYHVKQAEDYGVRQAEILLLFQQPGQNGWWSRFMDAYGLFAFRSHLASRSHLRRMVSNRTQLHHAAHYGITQYVKAYLERRDESDVNIKDGEGCTALMLASWKGHDETIRLLLSVGVNPRIYEKMHWLHANKRKVSVDSGSTSLGQRTALHGATFYGHLESVKILINLGNATIECKTSCGETPLMLAAEKEHRRIVEFLLDKGAKATAKNVDGRNALFSAARHNSMAMATLLIKRGCRADSKDRNGMTPLFEAVDAGCLEMSEYLLIKEGVDANARDSDGQTPLFRATGKHIDLLLSTPTIDPDPRDIFGRTPLSYAAEDRRWDDVSRLLSSGRVNPCVKSNEGLSPLHYTRLRSSAVVVQLMQEYIRLHGLKEYSTSPNVPRLFRKERRA